METRRFSGIYAAIRRTPDGKSVLCTGILTFNREGRLSGEFTGGELVWTASRQRDAEIKSRVKKYIQGDLEKTAGVKYFVGNDKIFLVDKKVYNKVLKKAKLSYTRWLESQPSEP